MKKIFAILLLSVFLISFASAGIIGDLMEWLFGKDVDTVLKDAGRFLELPADLVAVEQALGWD